MWVLGIAGSHNSAAALVHDGRVVVAVQTERLTRIKRHPIVLPRMSMETAKVIEYCLRTAGIDLPDVDVIATCSPYDVEAGFVGRDAPVDHRELAPFVSVPHHLAHAEYVLHYAQDRPALVLVADGSGTPEAVRHRLDVQEVVAPHAVCFTPPDGKESLSAYVFDGRDLRLVHRVARGLAPLPAYAEAFDQPHTRLLHSLGHLWQWAAYYCHGSTSEAGKVMGLAPYGDPERHADLASVRMAAGGDLVLDFPALFARAREPNSAGLDVTGNSHFEDVAAHVQRETNTFLAELVGHLLHRHRLDRVCYSGGVALNGISNEHLVRTLGIDLQMNGSCEDNGTAIGAALAVHHQRIGVRVAEPVTDTYGRAYADPEVDHALDAAGVVVERATPREVARRTARALAGGEVVAWFQGRSEFGPRALGNRSILADPRDPDMPRRLNAEVKHREAFRPFAPAVLAERASEYFDLDGPSPMMLRVVPVRSSRLPAVTHVDGSARVQTVARDDNPVLHGLLTEFAGLTGVPVLLNTSLNVAGEPIVESPEDALRSLAAGGLDLLVIGGRLVRPACGHRRRE
ncbi:carbamoyltransferase family protein [Nocardioides aequoreus]|uniref:carbamoyltransferase family protein n=1 Tax=Nocardioides aequoreus TaxID=397278 RepID=UPI00068FFC39|nr:carbamoyltransferase C-terminal domain-containing protein [Nocardioides aequoreus]